jgi:hypothetical protein
MLNTNLNEVAAEALALFRDKLAGKVIDEQRFYELRKKLTLVATAGLPYQWERLGDYMSHAQHWIDQAKPPLTEEKQTALYERLESWIEMRLVEAAKAGAPRADAPNIAARGAVASSGSGVRHPGKKI